MVLTYCLLPPTKKEVNAIARDVCLSVCLLALARLLQNTWMDFDEILRVDRCRDMDELIQLLSPIRIIAKILGINILPGTEFFEFQRDISRIKLWTDFDEM